MVINHLISDLIRAFNKYSDTGYGTLVILGEGDERSNLEKLINYNEKEKVRLWNSYGFFNL